MTKITFVSADGTETTIDAKDGDSLMQTAVSNNVSEIVGECGGSMMCATCHVYVGEEFSDLLSPRSAGEDEMLDCTAAERLDASRLSCQIIVSPKIEGLVVVMPDEQQ